MDDALFIISSNYRPTLQLSHIMARANRLRALNSLAAHWPGGSRDRWGPMGSQKSIRWAFPGRLLSDDGGWRSMREETFIFGPQKGGPNSRQNNQKMNLIFLIFRRNILEACLPWPLKLWGKGEVCVLLLRFLGPPSFWKHWRPNCKKVDDGGWKQKELAQRRTRWSRVVN